jgi:hypothetical protein
MNARFCGQLVAHGLPTRILRFPSSPLCQKWRIAPEIAFRAAVGKSDLTNVKPSSIVRKGP